MSTFIPDPVNQWDSVLPLGADPEFRDEDYDATLAARGGQVYYVFGPPGRARIISCALEQVSHLHGEPDVRAVVFTCALCNAQGRIDRDTKPFRIEPLRAVIRTADGPHPVRPLLTVMTPVECGQVLIVENDAGGTEERPCVFRAIIRKGIAFDLEHVPRFLEGAAQTLQEMYARAYAARQEAAKAGRTHPKADQDLHRAYAALSGAARRVHDPAPYDRDGPGSIVGVWDELDAGIAACRRVLHWAGGVR